MLLPLVACSSETNDILHLAAPEIIDPHMTQSSQQIMIMGGCDSSTRDPNSIRDPVGVGHKHLRSKVCNQLET